ncbi:MAG: MjaI family restriction endonuclease [Planctomycetales bacterium 4572_13]|nr:MAG: MjaI family restriction endonuclease [Planctomycetales bacterium 4572_13]
MAKEWALNSATNRFQLNFKRNVGAVSEEIRKCQPKTVEQWRDYYFENVRDHEHIEELGKKLYIKITEVISAEIEQITEQDCIDYLFNLVIHRTFDGYMTEITTIYGQLQQHFDLKIEPAQDEWDRLFNVDFFIKVNDYYIGLQIKPVSDVSQIPQIYKERSIQAKTHEIFTEKFGGQVFYIFSGKEGKKKVIQNEDVISEIASEIDRLNFL